MTRLRPALAMLVLALFPFYLLAVLGGLVLVVVLVAQAIGGGAVLAKLLVLPFVLAIWYAVRFALRVRPTLTEGPELREQEHPALWAEVRRLAEVVGTRAPDRIVLVPEVNAAVSEVGPVREMVIGLPLLASMSVAELRSVLAHELGHYAGGDTALSARLLRARMFLAAVHGGAKVPVRWVLGLYVRVYGWASAAATRDAERRADEFSVEVAGPRAAIAAMRRLVAADLAWGLLLGSYLGMFETSRSRASLTEGLRNILSHNDPEASVDEVIASEKSSLADTHPPVRDRIRDFEAARAAGREERPWSGGDAPATSLLAGGVEWLTGAERTLLVVDRPLATWDEVVAEAGAQAVHHDATNVAAHLRNAGHGDGSLRSLLELADATSQPGAPGLGERLGAGPDAEEADGVAAWALRSAVASRLVESGQARFAPRWDGPMALVAPDGTELDLDVVVDEAVRRPDGGTVLRGWLDRHGVGVTDGAPAAGVDLRPTWEAAMSNVTGPWDGRCDVHLYSTGLLALPLAREVVKEDKSRSTTRHQAPRLRAAAAQDLDTLRAVPGALWWDVGDIAAGEADWGFRVKVGLRLADGTSHRLTTTLETELVDPDAVRGALSRLFSRAQAAAPS